uniref:Metalloprotease n=1 Tax=Bursaphelenchus xylophilus TaxID=6326 RepID=A0A1I7RHI9_BURXY
MTSLNLPWLVRSVVRSLMLQSQRRVRESDSNKSLESLDVEDGDLKVTVLERSGFDQKLLGRYRASIDGNCLIDEDDPLVYVDNVFYNNLPGPGKPHHLEPPLLESHRVEFTQSLGEVVISLIKRGKSYQNNLEERALNDSGFKTVGGTPVQ